MTSLRGPTELQMFLDETQGVRPEHVHHANCPIIYQQPSLYDFWANQATSAIMHNAGLWSLLKFDHPQENDSFLDSVILEMTIPDDGSEILVSPSLLGRGDGLRHYNPDEYAPILSYSVTDLQRLFPGLPSRETHRDSIEQPPEHTDDAWLRTAMRRYFAVPILWTSPRGQDFIVIESCFNLEFFLFLQKLAYTFGWPGYPDKFPLRHFPMATVAFERGAHFPWANLLFAELLRDLTKYQNRLRECPRLIRVWTMIYDEAIFGSPRPSTPDPLLYLFTPGLFESRENGQGFSHFHYHAEDISYFTPREFLPMLNQGACRGPPNCPDDLESPD